MIAPLRTVGDVAKRLNVSDDQVAAFFESQELVGVDMSLDGPSRKSFWCAKCRSRLSAPRRFENRKLKCPIDGTVMMPPKSRRRDLRFRDEDVDRFLEERFRQSAIAIARSTLQQSN